VSDPRIAGIACLAGIARWKRKRLATMLCNAHGPAFANSAASAVKIAKVRGGAIACWASRVPAGLEALAGDAGVPLWWIEDGFLRSAGLGAALVPPGSITLDSRRPHYDASAPSDLEVMLQARDFTPAELARAEALLARLRETAVTKYNLAGPLPDLPRGRRLVLVLGQVEEDRSVLLGGQGLGIADLLARARAEEPDALLIYKPHPDVVAGLRSGALAAPEADLILPDADLPRLLDRVDAVHTLTSLAGFEALVRGRDVVVHGAPFYAGWGLTRDRAAPARRTRRRSLAELTAAALIAYPLYADPRTGMPCTVEQLVEALARTGPQRPRASIAARLAAWHAGRRAQER
jgi:capsule polysaccharide export protein KpsC/LpsZ